MIFCYDGDDAYALHEDEQGNGLAHNLFAAYLSRCKSCFDPVSHFKDCFDIFDFLLHPPGIHINHSYSQEPLA